MDQEVEAMSAVTKALDGLDSDAVGRVLRWAVERYEVAVKAGPTLRGSGSGTESGEPLPAREFATYDELFDAANPQTGLDRVLVTAYWYQVIGGEGDWDSLTINNDLKHLGHQSTNITRDLGALIKRTPRLVLQVRKEGSSRQARKRYKLTREGIRAVEAMLNATGTPVEG